VPSDAQGRPWRLAGGVDATPKTSLKGPDVALGGLLCIFYGSFELYRIITASKIQMSASTVSVGPPAEHEVFPMDF
jgi:hypothetical protein